MEVAVSKEDMDKTELNHGSFPHSDDRYRLLHKSNNFDFIRMLAASLVILWHTAALTGHNTFDPLFNLSSGTINSGNIGVGIFFITSGFLISGSLTRDSNLIRFYYNRMLRILPGLCLSVLTCILIFGPLATDLGIADYFRNHLTWVFLRNIFVFSIQWNLPGCFTGHLCTTAVNGSLWTIPHEVTCYIVIGILGFIGFLRFQSLIVFLYLTLLGMHHAQLNGYGWMFPSKINGNLLFPDFIELSLLFTSGVMLNTFFSGEKTRSNITILCFIFLIISILSGSGKECLPIFLPYLIFHLAYSQRISLSRFGKYGDFSYGTYLYAFPIQQYLSQEKFSIYKYPIVHFSISLLFSIVCGAISWHLVEKHFMKLKSKNNFNIFGTVPHIQSIIYGLIDTFLIDKMKILSSIILLTIPISMCYFFIHQHAPTSTIKFSRHPKGIHLSGSWLDQGIDEPYRWVDKSGAITLSQPAGISHLHFVAYVPAEFRDVSQLTLLINDSVICEKNRFPDSTGAWPIDIRIPVESDRELDSLLMIKFNGEHVPEHSDADQRKLSAAISEISIE